ncbi:MAG TPA: hypothetical protein PKY81_04660, partial [bacterium]|nr:hypothetical protein [bacterium]
MYYKGYLNSWGSAVMTNISGVWKTTVQAGSGSGSTGFKIANTTDWSGSDWSTGGAISLNTIVNFSLGGANTLI